MKHIYLFLLLFFSVTISNAQEDLLGDWFLHYFSKNGNIQYSTIANNDQPATFSEDSFTGSGEYSLTGSYCGDSGYGADFDFISPGNISFYDFNVLANCGGTELSIFGPSLGVMGQQNCTYEIIGTGLDQTVKITNPDGDFVVYGKYNINQEELIGEWYLSYLIYEGQQLENIGNPLFNLIIPTHPGADEFDDEGYTVTGDLICNGYSAIYYIVDTEILQFNYTNVTLSECQDPNDGDYEDYYTSIVLNSNQSGGNGYFLDYDIIGSGTNATLTLTNNLTGNSATFTRQSLVSEQIAGNWFLNSIDTGSNEDNTSPNFNIQFDNELSQYSGLANCNAYDGTFTILDGATMSFSNCSIESNTCSTNFDFETDFTVFISCNDTSSNMDTTEVFYTYEFIGTGDDATLQLTSTSSGDVVIFGRQSLSNSSFSQQRITVFPNPVNEVLTISNNNINTKYSIYSIDGKTVINNTSLKESIDVSALESGLYFLKIDNNLTIRFIKL